MDSSRFAAQEPSLATGRGQRASRPTAKIAEHQQQIQKSAQRREQLAQTVAQSESSHTITPISESLPPVTQAPVVQAADNSFLRDISLEEWQEMDPTKRHWYSGVGFSNHSNWNTPLAARSTAEQELAEFREWQASRMDPHLSHTAATAFDVPLDVPSILTRDVISGTPWHNGFASSQDTYSNGEALEREGSPEPADGGLEEPILRSVMVGFSFSQIQVD
ncbi:hypothetical protein EW026_g8429 [Hermanssonia centrifuga]|uniref:Uncharacterized protein n=1 Tax=Hermanssonia centrifuga TaxID=98765 RepID=A0A4S4K474_9APHY|nr:hypothetical protein EW026_g8429 [Hermanssonia centrifuga]